MTNELARPRSPAEQGKAEWVKARRSRDNCLEIASIQGVVLAASAASTVVFSKAFLEKLGEHAADSAADLLKRGRFRRLRTKGKPDECHITVGDNPSTTVIFTGDLPDDARLALLDLDVTAEELRGQTLRWDSKAMAWRVGDAQE
jgi:hypothetical protein